MIVALAALVLSGATWWITSRPLSETDRAIARSSVAAKQLFADHR